MDPSSSDPKSDAVGGGAPGEGSIVDEAVAAAPLASGARPATESSSAPIGGNPSIGAAPSVGPSPFAASEPHVMDDPFASRSPSLAASPAAMPPRVMTRRCAVHGEREATMTCARCGAFGCEACHFGGPSRSRTARSVCMACASGGLPAPIGIERIGELGLPRAVFQTVRDVMLAPRQFFRTPSVDDSLVPATIFVAIPSTVGQVISLSLIMLVSLAVLGVSSVTAGTSSSGELGAVLGSTLLGVFVYVPCVGVMTIVASYVRWTIFALMAHGTLAVLGASKRPFDETMRASAYTFAPEILAAIPWIGAIVGVVWGWVLDFHAVRETHRTTADRAVLAAFGIRFLVGCALLSLYGAMTAMVIALILNQGDVFGSS